MSYILQLRLTYEKLFNIATGLCEKIRITEPDFKCEILPHVGGKERDYEKSIKYLEDIIEKLDSYFYDITWEDLEWLIPIQKIKNIKNACGYLMRYVQSTATVPKTGGASGAMAYMGLTIERIPCEPSADLQPMDVYNNLWNLNKIQYVPSMSASEIFIKLIQESNDIARDTRRGTPRTVIVSEPLFDIIRGDERYVPVNIFEEGRLVRRGGFGRFTIIVDYKMTTEKKALMSYRGDKDNDGGACIVTYGNLHAFCTDYFTDKYFRRIHFQ